MKHFSIFSVIRQIRFLLFALILVIAGCSLEKQSGFNRAMQNLTAHFNILFNAKEILRLKQESYATSFIDNYNEILSVYPDTTARSSTTDKDLDAAITKANTIINIKEQSTYLGDAYLVLGKANYLGGNYFNAVEYFSYVIRSFPKRHDLVQDALTWKARTLIYLDQLPQAKLALDTAILNINLKKREPVNIYAAKLQYDIDVQEYADGEEMAKQAITYSKEKTERLRWTFILAQLQELNHKQADAITNYTKIAKSNAAFEMAFNASLNRIRIEESLNGVKISRIDRLKELLKEPNNKEFKDQIYYQIAELLAADKDIDNAIKNYKLSVRNSTKNQNQKGLSYLRLAQINFKIKADYVSAKKYYDSTLTTLPINYPGYPSIKKIGNNLQLLVDRLQIITREDTLQALAKMDEKTRATVIDKMVSDRVLQQQAIANAATANAAAGINDSGPQSNVGGNSTFYFYNSTAVGQGFTDFKRIWGNRKLEDNWRRSNRSNSDITNNTANSTQTNDPDALPGQAQKGKTTSTAGNYRQELTQGLPLTPALVVQSNQHIYNAYVDIGNLYRDLLDDKKEAIAAYETVLRRFPDDPNKPAIYYNLYRLYSDIDPAKSDHYKNILLKEYANTPFAKVISDPDYAKKLDDKDAEFTQVYNSVFDLYADKKYKEVVKRVPEVLKQYPGNKFAAQLYYLKAIAEGHDEKAQPFKDSLQKVAANYPEDKLVTPLINQHLTYMAGNMPELQARNVVLMDNDPRDMPFTLDPAMKEETEYRKRNVAPYFATVPGVRLPDKKQPAATPPQTEKVTPPPVTKPVEIAKVTPPVVNKPVDTTKAIKQVVSKAVDTAKAIQQAVNKPVDTIKTTQPGVTPAVTQAAQIASQPAVTEPDAAPPLVTSIFSKTDSTNYYFVVNVSSGTTNLASSRFGFGQFNRVNYTGKGIKHNLKPVETGDQLLYVGRFYSLADVKNYARQIVPLLPDIMKVPKDKYSFFIITQENLDKLADKNKLDSYIDYYQKNY